MTEEQQHDADQAEVNRPPDFWQALGSAFAAAFGVQSSKNRERDFQHGKFGYFMAAGIIFTVFFLLGIYSVVQLVLH